MTRFGDCLASLRWVATRTEYGGRDEDERFTASGPHAIGLERRAARLQGIQVRSQPMPGNARCRLDRKDTLGGDTLALNPARDGALRPESEGARQSGLPARGLAGFEQRGKRSVFGVF